MWETEKGKCRREDMQRQYREPANRRLKYVALAVGMACVLIPLMVILRPYDFSLRTILVLRGCMGVLAVVFVVLTGILVYRVNRSYWRGKKEKD